MIKYDYTFFHNVLLRQRSLNFERYQHVTEIDLLMHALNFGEISDDSEVDWQWLKEKLYGKEHLEMNSMLREVNGVFMTAGPSRSFNISGELEDFMEGIASREVRVRILSFLRDHCREYLFDDTYKDTCVCAFETECARLISDYIKESKMEQASSESAEINPTDLTQIALAPSKRQKYSIMENTILNAVPSIPDIRYNIPKEVLLQVAYDFWDYFRKSVKKYEDKNRDERFNPQMSQSECEDTIMRMIRARRNSSMVARKYHIYQVYFILGCLMGMPDHRHSQFEEECSINICDYLEQHPDFKGSKEKINEVINNLLTLSLYQLDFDAASIEKTMNKAKHQQEQQVKASSPKSTPKSPIPVTEKTSRNNEESAEKQEVLCPYINGDALAAKHTYTVQEFQTMLRQHCEQEAKVLVQFLIQQEKYGNLDFHGANKKQRYNMLRQCFPTMRVYSYQNFADAYKAALDSI